MKKISPRREDSWWLKFKRVAILDFGTSNVYFCGRGFESSCGNSVSQKRIGASYSIRSGRYVNMAEAEYVIPESIKRSPLLPKYKKHLESVQKMYKELTDSGIPKKTHVLFNRNL